MKTVAEALKPLDDSGRRRVIVWARDKFLGGSVRPESPATDTGRSKEGADMSERAGAAGAQVLANFPDLAEAYHAFRPQTDAEKALVVGAWMQQAQHIDGLDSFRINSELKHLGYRIGNITRALEYLIVAKPALMLQLRKSGTSKQARKTYRVTDAGFKKLALLLAGGEAT